MASCRQPAGPVALIVAALALAACAGDPVEVAARGAEELARHRTSEWVRLEHPALVELEYEVSGAHVDPAHPGAIDLDIEHPTTFRQRFDSGGRPLRPVIDELRASLVERGAIARGNTCDAIDEETNWHFSVESEGDWLQIRLTERSDGLDHWVLVYERPGLDYGDHECR